MNERKTVTREPLMSRKKTKGIIGIVRLLRDRLFLKWKQS